MFGFVMVRGFNFHTRHVHTGGAIAFATFAAHTQVHGLEQFVAAQCVYTKLTTQSQTQGVGATAREVLFIARDAVAGAHGACIKLATGAVVVAHLHRFGKTLCRVTTGARCRGFFGGGVVLHIPCAPVERCLYGDDFVVIAKTHQRGVVHLRWIDDALR